MFGAGCAAVLDRKPVEKQRFVLAPAPPEPVSGPRAGVLRVGVVRVSPPFQNRGFVSAPATRRYATDFYNEFAAPPGILLRDVLVEWLREGTHFEIGGARHPRRLPTGCWRRTSSRSSSIVRDAAAPPQVAIAIAARLLDARARRCGDPLRRNATR